MNTHLVKGECKAFSSNAEYNGECGEYEPRYTRQQRHEQSLKGQLKAAQQAEKRLDHLCDKYQKTMDKLNLKAGFYGAEPHQVIEILHDEIEMAEHRGLEAVAKVAQDADKKVKTFEKDIDDAHALLPAYMKWGYANPTAKSMVEGLVKSLEENSDDTLKMKVEYEKRLAASVPLANALVHDGCPESRVKGESVDGTFLQEIKFTLARGHVTVNPRDVVLHKKDKEEKPNGN